MCLDLNIYNDYDLGINSRPNYFYEREEVLIVNFTVISRRTGLTYEVYAVKNSEFLIFFNGNFVWRPMSEFRPNKKTEQERMVEEKTKSTMFKSQQSKGVMYP